VIDVQTIPVLTLPSVPFAERRSLPGCAAIYFVLDGQDTVLYIGCSVNLAERWRAHHQARKLTDKGATRIAWLVMDDVTLLAGVEAACIVYFEPPCNTSIGGYSKDPYTLGEPLVTLTGRFPLSLVSRIDAYVESMRRATPGLNIGRSDALRTLVLHALDVLNGSAVAATEPPAPQSPTRQRVRQDAQALADHDLQDRQEKARWTRLSRLVRSL
jgi:hypothetical protein